MPSEDYFVATDPEALRMENELLMLENTYLKGRILSLEQDLRQAKTSEAEARKQLRRAREEARGG